MGFLGIGGGGGFLGIGGKGGLFGDAFNLITHPGDLFNPEKLLKMGAEFAVASTPWGQAAEELLGANPADLLLNTLEGKDTKLNLSSSLVSALTGGGASTSSLSQALQSAIEERIKESVE